MLLNLKSNYAFDTSIIRQLVGIEMDSRLTVKMEPRSACGEWRLPYTQSPDRYPTKYFARSYILLSDRIPVNNPKNENI